MAVGPSSSQTSPEAIPTPWRAGVSNSPPFPNLAHPCFSFSEALSWRAAGDSLLSVHCAFGAHTSERIDRPRGGPCPIAPALIGTHVLPYMYFPDKDAIKVEIYDARTGNTLRGYPPSPPSQISPTSSSATPRKRQFPAMRLVKSGCEFFPRLVSVSHVRGLGVDGGAGDL